MTSEDDHLCIHPIRATALMVLGPERGMAIAERLGLPVLFIIERDGQFEERVCCAFQRYRRQELS